MTIDARKRAERCFALARSTTFEGERSNAISMGTKIATDAGLALDDFDIPGRQRARETTKPPGRTFRDDLFRPSGASPWTHEFDREINESIRRAARAFTETQVAERMKRERAAYEAQIRATAEAAKRAAERAGAKPGETAQEAAKRNFDDAVRSAKERDAKRDLHQRAKKAADLLAPRGVRAYPQGDGWIVEFRGELVAATAFEVIQLHREIAEREVMRAGWSPTWGDRRICPGCDKVILFGDSCTECAQR